MLARHAKAYSSSCSQTVSLSPAVQPFRRDFYGVPQFDALVRRFPWT